MIVPLKSSFKERCGAALVVVLAILVLLVGLAVGFLLTAGTERRAVRGYKAGMEARQLAETAVNLAQAQIHQATSGLGGTSTWASQPGMIRTFAGAGPATGYYKLYSSPEIFVTSFGPTEAAAEVPSNWFSLPDDFTDLNAPVVALNGTQRFPIVHPGAEAFVEGFSIDDNAPVESGGNPAPMPVRWLYVLSDGQIAPRGAPAITADNPPVGRVAFWTDDDTAKINVNTASLGTYWDTPRVNSQQDRRLGEFQPVQNEFQRYPGHPAMTSLQPVFGSVLANASDYYDISPRVSAGGSEGGTITAIGMLPLKKDRLYSTVEEILLDPARNLQGLTRDDIEKSKFFLTAHSRAPDINLFNRPRVSLWPIHVAEGVLHRTPYDNLMAFCSTVGHGGNPSDRVYYFQRSNPYSATSDIRIARNQVLLDYLRNMTGAEIPGFGGNFDDKYPDDRDQILTQIFDYARTTNIMDSSTATILPYAIGVDGSNNPLSGASAYSSPGSGQIVPSYDEDTDTRGFGRFPTVSELAIVFFATDTPESNPQSETNPDGVPEGKIRVRAFLVPEMFTVTQGWPPIAHNWYLRISGHENITVEDQPIFAGSPGRIRVRGRNAHTNQMNSGGQDGPGIIFRGLGSGRRDTGTNDLESYPFVSQTIDIDNDGENPQFEVEGATVTVEVQGPTGDPVQTLQFPFAGTLNLPVPEGNETVDENNFSRLSMDENGRFKISGATVAQGKLAQVLVTSRDAVRSWIAGGVSGGDVRILAAKRSVGPENFEKPSGFDDPGNRFAHSLKGAAYTQYGGLFGRLVENAEYSSNFPGGGVPPFEINDPYATYGTQGRGQVIRTWFQDVPANGVRSGTLPGDWDTGVSTFPDGAYINKADEGNIQGIGSGIPYFADNANNYEGPTPTYFSPNRMLPSAGMLGSLPTGVKSGNPWRTLHFRPHPSAHFGNAQGPHDHLLLDLFHVPVVEPYAISEPLSTAGRVNMNYQIMPFTYLNRETGIHGVLDAEKVIAIPATDAGTYKGGAATATEFRHPINVNQTLEGFRRRFATGEIFRSASEICEIHLVPDFAGATYDGMTAFWNIHALTGDNARERPYANLYPRLTTKSNTFTVHYRVQALQPLMTKSGFDPNKDFTVISEIRGSATIERYVDPNDERISTIDFASAPLSDNNADLSSYYRLRTLNWRQFAP